MIRPFFSARLASFAVASNLWVALCMAGIPVSVGHLHSLPLAATLCSAALTFLLALTIYTLDRLLDRTNASLGAGVFMLMAGLAGGHLALRTPPRTQRIFVALLFIGAAYRWLKRIPLAKAPLVGTVVAAASVGFPFGLAGVPVPWVDGCIVATTVAMVVATFDLRDIPADEQDGTPTLPVLFGPLATRRAVWCFGLLASGLALLGSGIAHPEFVAWPLIAGTVGFLLNEKSRPDSFAWFADGSLLMLLPLCISHAYLMA
jgi:4-hydroxybenzoate polyprenyltransferase